MLPVIGLAMYAIAVALGFRYSPRRTQLVLTRIGTTTATGATTIVNTGQQTVNYLLYAAVVSLLLITCGGISILVAAFSGWQGLFWFMFAIATASIFVAMLGWYAFRHATSQASIMLESAGERIAQNWLSKLLIFPAAIGGLARLAGFAARNAAAVGEGFFRAMACTNVTFHGFAAFTLIIANSRNPELLSDLRFMGLLLALGIVNATATMAKIKTFSFLTLTRVTIFVTLTFLAVMTTLAFPVIATNVGRISANHYNALLKKLERVAGNGEVNTATYVKAVRSIDRQYKRRGQTLNVATRDDLAAGKTGVLVFPNEPASTFGKSPRKWVCVLWIDDPSDPLMDLDESSPRATWVDNEFVQRMAELGSPTLAEPSTTTALNQGNSVQPVTVNGGSITSGCSVGVSGDEIIIRSCFNQTYILPAGVKRLIPRIDTLMPVARQGKQAELTRGFGTRDATSLKPTLATGMLLVQINDGPYEALSAPKDIPEGGKVVIAINGVAGQYREYEGRYIVQVIR